MFDHTYNLPLKLSLRLKQVKDFPTIFIEECSKKHTFFHFTESWPDNYQKYEIFCQIEQTLPYIIKIVSMIKTFIVCLCLTCLILTQEDIQPQAQDTKTNNIQGANFEGHFDSIQMNGPGIVIDPEQVEDSQQIDSREEEEQRDMLEFSQNMADFIPDQTFTFKMNRNSQQVFLLAPAPDILSVRGMFHSQVTEDQQQSHVNLILYDNDEILRNYRQQRLGIFNIQHTSKDHLYKLQFTSSDSEIDVYVSYELISKQKKQSQQNANLTDLQGIANQFSKVSKIMVSQQTEMKRVMEVSKQHEERIDKYIQYFAISLTSETLIIVLGSINSLLILRKQLYAGYELLV